MGLRVIFEEKNVLLIVFIKLFWNVVFGVVWWGCLCFGRGNGWKLEWYFCNGENGVGIEIFIGVGFGNWCGWLFIGVVWKIFLLGKVMFGVFVGIKWLFFVKNLGCVFFLFCCWEEWCLVIFSLIVGRKFDVGFFCCLGWGVFFGMLCSCFGCMFFLGLLSFDLIDGNNVEFFENKKVNMYIIRNINIVEYWCLGKFLFFIMI